VTLRLTWRRWLTQKLLRSCAVVLPEERSLWAAAMRVEAQHIDDDGVALKWALGSMRAGFAERLRTMRVHKMLTLRALAVLWIAMFVFSSAFNVCIALAARLRLQSMACAMGWLLLDGFRYDRFVPFADAMPAGLFVLMGLVVVLFAVSLTLSLRRRPAAFAAFCGAVGLSLVAWLYQLGIPAYMQALSPQHRWRIGACFVLTAGVLSALRFGGAAPNASLERMDGSAQ
jgi:hypothetical protein